jgi:hypothetical protein
LNGDRIVSFKLSHVIPVLARLSARQVRQK